MRRSHQRLAIEAMEAERERRLLLLAREDAEMLEERHVLQQQVRDVTLTLTPYPNPNPNPLPKPQP